MEPGQSLSTLTGNLLAKLECCLSCSEFGAVLVQGDTTSAMVASLVAFYNRIPIGHIEAGLRTGNINSPFPEEFNRRTVALAANWHFAPTWRAAANLVREGLSDNIHIVGNSVIDAASMIAQKRTRHVDALYERFPFLADSTSRHVLVTAHRRENFGDGIHAICMSLSLLAERNQTMQFIFPVHPNPNVKVPIIKLLGDIPNIHIIDPLSYDEILHVMKHAFIVVTDSGGIQEEAPSFNLPIIVTRKDTERPEGVEAGCSVLAGISVDGIVGTFESIMNDPKRYSKMAMAENPYGDGRTSIRIVDIMCRDL